MRLYLASTSPARLATLRAAGVEPVVLAPGVDEEALTETSGVGDAVELVAVLARAKAEAVVGRVIDGADIDGFILGGDSAFELDGRVYGKPLRADVATERWLQQRGRTGYLHTGHWLIDHRAGRVAGAFGAVSSSLVQFADDITDEEIDAYVATGEPLGVAGAFTIDSLGAAYIRRIEGDPHAVVGLSLSVVRDLLGQFGVRWNVLWNRGL